VKGFLCFCSKGQGLRFSLFCSLSFLGFTSLLSSLSPFSLSSLSRVLLFSLASLSLLSLSLFSLLFLSALSFLSLVLQETSSVANGQAYHLSKVMAEKEAWKVAEAKGIDLVTVNPNFVLGPALSAAPDGGGSISVSYIKGMVEGKAASGSPIICDVRVVAAENPDAKGRYIVSQPGAVLPETMAEAIRGAVRDAGFGKEAALLPPAEASPAGETGKARIDASRTVEELGVSLRSPEETLRDAARSLIKLGVAVPASKV
jgi:nucleoside-diphosphate-sugar epimerase